MFSKGLANTTNLLNVSGKVIGLFKSISSGIAGIASDVKQFGTECFDAFNKSEQSLKQLEYGLKGIGDSDSFDRLIQKSNEFQSQSIFSNEEIQTSMAMLTGLKMNGDQIARNIPAVMDLAAAYKQVTGDTDSLNTITRLLTTSAGDELFTALGKVGVVLTDTDKDIIKSLDGAERYNEVMGHLKGKFDGVSQTLSTSTLGGMQQLSNTWNDIQVAVGGVISEALQPVINILQELWPVIGEGVNALGGFAKEWASAMLEASGFKMETGELVEVLKNLIQEGFAKIIEIGRELMPTFKELYTEVGKLIGENTNLTEVLKDLVLGIMDVIAWFVKWLAKIQAISFAFMNFIKNINSTIDDLVNDVIKWFSDPIPDTWVKAITNIVESAKKKLQDLIDFIKDLNPLKAGGLGSHGYENPGNYFNEHDSQTDLIKGKGIDVDKYRLEQQQKEEELTRLQLGYVNDMWSNFQGMLQATGLMKTGFGEIINIINGLISGASSGLGFLESIAGFIGTIIPGGGAVTAIAGVAGGLNAGFNSNSVPRINIPTQMPIPAFSRDYTPANTSVNVTGDIRVKGSDLLLAWRRETRKQQARGEQRYA